MAAKVYIFEQSVDDQFQKLQQNMSERNKKIEMSVAGAVGAVEDKTNELEENVDAVLRMLYKTLRTLGTFSRPL